MNHVHHFVIYRFDCSRKKGRRHGIVIYIDIVSLSHSIVLFYIEDTYQDTFAMNNFVHIMCSITQPTAEDDHTPYISISYNVNY